jgi:hypothetical protein
MENIRNQIQKSLDKGSSGDIFSLKIDLPTKEILKSVSLSIIILIQKHVFIFVFIKVFSKTT